MDAPGAPGRGNRAGGRGFFRRGGLPGRFFGLLLKQAAGRPLELIRRTGRGLLVGDAGRLHGRRVQRGGKIGDLPVQQRGFGDLGRRSRFGGPGGFLGVGLCRRAGLGSGWNLRRADRFRRRRGSTALRHGTAGAGRGGGRRSHGGELGGVGGRRFLLRLRRGVGSGRGGAGGDRGFKGDGAHRDGILGAGAGHGGFAQGRRFAAHREPGAGGAGLALAADEQQGVLPPGAEGDGGAAQMQPQRAAAHQVQNVVGDGGIGQVGAEGTGRSPLLAAQQHKGRLAHRGGHIDGGIVRPRQLHGDLGAAGGGLHHIAGELFEQGGGGHDALGIEGTGIGLCAEIEGGLAVLQPAQRAAQQPAGQLVGGHQQAPLFEQGIQRGLGQRGIPHAVNRVAKAVADFPGPAVAVFVSHGLGGGGCLDADKVLPVPLL